MGKDKDHTKGRKYTRFTEDDWEHKPERSKINPERIEEFARIVREGGSKSEAAEAIGISHRASLHWYRKGRYESGWQDDERTLYYAFYSRVREAQGIAMAEYGDYDGPMSWYEHTRDTTPYR